MNRNQTKKIAGALAALSVTAILPTTASAQNWQDWVRSKEGTDRRQQTKNQWRNLAILGGAATVFGLLKNDRTITFAGAAGALYSLNRYEQDRKSQSREAQARAELFSRPYFERDGRRYERRETVRNGQQYYYFVRR